MKYFHPNQLISLERLVSEEGVFELTREIVFDHPDVEVEVNPGFLTDGASISFGRYLIGCPFEKKYLGPAIIHDAMYIYGCNRGWANDIFYDALLDVGFSKWRSWAMHKAVDIGGPFVKYTPDQERHARCFLNIVSK